MENNITAIKGWKNPWVIITLISIILIAGIVVVSILRDRIVNQQQWTINFVGQGKIDYTPDIANINIGVQIDKKEKAEDALKELNQKTTDIFKAIEEVGIAKENIQTQNYSLYPQYDIIDGVSKPAGYNANQVVVVRIKNIDKDPDLASKVISVATKAGANQVNGISFEPSNLESLKQEARIKAIEDARQKAVETAGVLGVKLGKLVNWWENYITPESQYIYADGKGGMGGGGGEFPTVPSGSREIKIEVSVNYLVK